MKKTSQLVTLATPWCVVFIMLASTHPVSADDITATKNSADFTFQYNGDTAPSNPSVVGEFGNTGYKAETLQNVTMISDGDILSVFPTVPNDPPIIPPLPAGADSQLNMMSADWDALIDDATGFTWEISLKLVPTPGTTYEDRGDGTFAEAGKSGTLSRNRVLIRVGDVDNNPDEVQPFSSAQLQIDLDGDLNNGGLRLESVIDDFHVYRMAQAPNSDRTHLWVDGELLSSELPLRTKAQPGHWWGDFWGETTAFDIDYVRWEVGAFAPADAAPSVTGDYNDSGQVEQGDLDLVLLNWGDPWPPEIPEWKNDQPTDDQKIDQNDLDGVLLNWGNTAAAGAPVPEPGSVALLLIVAVGGILPYRRVM